MPSTRLLRDMGFCTFSLCFFWFVAVGTILFVLMSYNHKPIGLSHSPARPTNGSLATEKVRPTVILLAQPENSLAQTGTVELQEMDSSGLMDRIKTGFDVRRNW